MPTVTRLQVAPVKSMSVVSASRLRLDADGVAEDRRMFLLAGDGSVVTLRRHPRLAAVLPELDLSSGLLAVTFPTGARVRGELAVGGPVSVRLFGRDRTGRVVPGPVAQALSDYVGEPLRLVLADRTGVGWDEGPVSLVGSASVRAVGGRPDRFRMLVEVDGTPAYREDGWVGCRVRLGEALVHVTHPLQRCVVIDHSPRTGVKDWAGLATIAGLRGRGQLTLGVIAQVLEPGTVRVGDPVEPPA